jgi:hypothetical protein
MCVFMIFIFWLPGCGTSSDQDHVNQDARLTKMLDEQRYEDVIHLIESDSNGTSDFPQLLAMAYLGKSGFVPLELASQVMAAQTESIPGLDDMVPSCDSGEIQRFQQIPIPCMLKRIWAHIPDADNPDFSKARSLFRSTYPDPASTPAKYNTLIGAVEAASALSRLGAVALKYYKIDPSNITAGDIGYLVIETSECADEALRTLQRAQHSIEPVSQLLTGLNQEPLLVNFGAGIEWGEATGLPSLIQFSSGFNGADQDAVKSALVQLLGQVVATLKN